ncbi:YceI family protein [Isosphaeraceae bacterium EP7]
MLRKILAVAALVVAASPVQAAEPYKVDTVHSSVIFRVKHMNVSYAYGRFNEIVGTFDLDETNPAQSKLDIKVATASIDTASKAREGHLQGPDFFSAKQFPIISFKSTKVAKTSEGAFDVTGDLTLHGVTKPLTLKIEPSGTGKGMKGEKLAGFETTFSIKRSEFGMTNMTGAIGDDVRLIVSIEGNRP